MRILRIALLQFKIMIRDKMVLGFMFLMPLVVTGIVAYIGNSTSGDKNYNVVAVINDKGNYGSELVDYIKENEKNFYSIDILNDENIAREKVRYGKVTSLLVIDSNFSQSIESGDKPEVKLIKNEDDNVSMKLSQSVDEFINKKILTEELKDKINISENAISSDLIDVKITDSSGSFDYAKLILILIINFIVFSANSVSSEILSQKKEKVLRRQLTTPNKPWHISGGLLLGFGLTQIVIYSLIINILKVVFKLNFGISIVTIILPLIAMIIFSISFGLFVVRLTSNEGLVSVITNIIGVAMGFISGSFTNNNIPDFLKVFSKLTPQYWFNEVLGGSSIIISTIFILLIAAVFFTAGSLKFTNFAKE
ncbi:MAG: ABC transporter permease [Clostridiaceae bacterium]